MHRLAHVLTLLQNGAVGRSASVLEAKEGNSLSMPCQETIEERFSSVGNEVIGQLAAHIR